MRIAITMGDGAGIGPELILKAFEQSLFSPSTVVIGDYSVMKLCQDTIGTAVPLVPYPVREEGDDHVTDFSASQSPPRLLPRYDMGAEPSLPVYDMRLLDAGDVTVGAVSARTGEAAARYVEFATALALRGEIDAIVTCPISKEATRRAFPSFTGHTELIAGLCGVSEVCMMLATSKLIVSHVTTHVSLATAIKKVTRERVLSVIRMTQEAVQRVSNTARIAVCGLNPHAGESGAFGTEEESAITPAITAARAEGLDITGPEPADTVFHRAVSGEFDAVVCMYHDQGHIPIKTLDFYGGVNVTLGLPIVRTSVDHGTAFDIAWQGAASTDSLHAAYRLAQRLVGYTD